MHLDASDRQTSFKKSRIKKGYYPAQLLRVVPFNDGDGKPKEGKYGRQLIFEYGIYKPHPDTNAPMEPMQVVDEDSKEKQDVIIAKFVYSMYRGKDGKLNTAVTPNSAITNILKAHGWTFTATGIDIDKYIRTWVEVNIDDYEQKGNESHPAYIASTIKDISPYKGPEPSKDLRLIAVPEFKETRMETSQKDLEKRRDAEAFAPDSDNPEVAKVKANMTEIESMKQNGFLTEDGYKMSMEKLNKKLADLQGKKV